MLTYDPDGVSPNPDDVFSDGEVARLVNPVFYSVQETMGLRGQLFIGWHGWALTTWQTRLVGRWWNTHPSTRSTPARQGQTKVDQKRLNESEVFFEPIYNCAPE